MPSGPPEPAALCAAPVRPPAPELAPEPHLGAVARDHAISGASGEDEAASTACRSAALRSATLRSPAPCSPTPRSPLPSPRSSGRPRPSAAAGVKLRLCRNGKGVWRGAGGARMIAMVRGARRSESFRRQHDDQHAPRRARSVRPVRPVRPRSPAPPDHHHTRGPAHPPGRAGHGATRPADPRLPRRLVLLAAPVAGVGRGGVPGRGARRRRLRPVVEARGPGGVPHGRGGRGQRRGGGGARRAPRGRGRARLGRDHRGEHRTAAA